MTKEGLQALLFFILYHRQTFVLTSCPLITKKCSLIEAQREMKLMKPLTPVTHTFQSGKPA